jgi:hypothetical protein
MSALFTPLWVGAFELPPEMPFSDSERAVGVVCCRAGWVGSPDRPNRASGLVCVIPGHRNPHFPHSGTVVI